MFIWVNDLCLFYDPRIAYYLYVRIPTMKLKIPVKSMVKAGYQTSVTFKL